LVAERHAWIEALDLTKRYGGVLALDGASLRIRAGEIRGLVGANGAGKSTLVKCLTGMVQPTAGSVTVDGQTLPLGRPAESLRRGIVCVPQELTVAPTMTVAENVMLGHEPTGVLGRLREGELRRRAEAALAALSFDIPVHLAVADLPLIEQRLVMVARALSYGPRLAIFDEPTATLSPLETERLLESIRMLAARGVSVLYVSHHLSEVEDLCDAVTVLRDGEVVADLERGLGTHRGLVELIAADRAGERSDRAARDESTDHEVVLDVRDVSGERLHGVGLVVHAGEVVGLAGLAGSGARELMLTICGAVPFATGTVELARRRLRSGSMADAVAAGAGYLPGDRSLGTFPNHSVRHNVSLAALAQHARAFFVNAGSERGAVAALLDRVALDADQEQTISSLSGGNQQKALVARWIASRARLLLLDDPTAGVDVATRPEIHAQIESLAEAGAGILLVSTDVDEIAELSDRVLVFERGSVTAELHGTNVTPARVLAAMTGRAREVVAAT
jgi:monosaccharide-transporting ATPase